MRSTLWLVALACILVCGCGKNRFATPGKLTRGGAPYTVKEGEIVRITFFPVTSDGMPPKNTYIANFDPASAAFKASGPDGKGIPPGKYRVAVEHQVKKKDVFKGAFDGDRSPFVYDVDAATKEIVIDLDKK